MNLLIISSHPDDIELGVGAIIHKLHSKHKFHGLILTSGALRGKEKNRESAAIASAKILGYSVNFARLEDGAFTEVEAEKAILKCIKEIEPDMVIGHSKNDLHRDHINAYIATVSASRKIKNVLFFEGPYSRGFNPNFYVSVSKENLEAKIRALNEHSKSLTEKPDYLTSEYNISLAKVRGMPIRSTYAEGFEVGILCDFI